MAVECKDIKEAYQVKFGVCVGPELFDTAVAAGFDYVEGGLSGIVALDEGAFDKLAQQVKDLPIPMLKCNGFCPASVKLTGPDASPRAWEKYLKVAMNRAKILGIRTAVLGSGGARAVPKGFPVDEAWRQFADFLRMAGDYALHYDVDIALEPLRRQECNILNLVGEATLLASMVNHPRINVLGDWYHMVSGAEPLSALTLAGERLRHIHISCPTADLSSRVFPKAGDGQDYAGLVATLRAMNYAGDISVEAGAPNGFAQDGAEAVACFRSLLAD